MILLFIIAPLIVAIVFFADQSMMAKEKKAKQAKHDKQEHDEKMKKAEREKIEQEKIASELNYLLQLIINDWNASIYPDKIDTPGINKVEYRFENGDRVILIDRTLEHHTSRQKITYRIGLIHRAKFVAAFNRIVQIVNNGEAKKRMRGNRNPVNGSSQSYNPSSNPRQKKYDLLMQTIKLRRENLMKMDKNDPDRAAMEFELSVAENKAAKIKAELN